MTQSTKDSIAAVIRESLAEILELPLDEIPENGDLKQDLDVDSLHQLELVGMLQSRLGVYLDADDLSEVGSIEGLAERAASKMGSPG